MNINKTNIFAKLYYWFYTDYPDDICSFFWTMLFTLLLFPITVVGRLIEGKYADSGELIGVGFIGWLIYAFMYISGIGFLHLFIKSEEIKEINGFIAFFGFPIFGAAVMGAIAGISYVIVTGFLKLFKLKVSTTFTENTANFIGAIKKTHCTKINWK